MSLIDIISEYVSQNIKDLECKYSWNINYNDVPVELRNNRNESLYVQNKKLRNSLHSYLLICDEVKKIDIIKWYIYSWGGIKRNSLETIRNYTYSSTECIISKEDRGISSWSKALSIRNPKKFCIYDSRVASSLNSLQLIHNFDDPIYFPALTSRNKIILKSIKNRKYLKESWQKSDKKTFYNYYLNLLDSIALKVGNGVDKHDIEMLLFADAENLVKKSLQ
ncbi:hypothetical protein BBC0244_022870 [Bartonella apihabitans]|uniref:hypothetical protein n=1 Tax=Bartonella apihabitans TaxID=2750929 RepID=UPI00098E8BD1|nr:hypothetical protein [Bartonella apihabitans]AQT45939.1 hypothetical protein BBC0244_022870 [Bartonella apihabitans]